VNGNSEVGGLIGKISASTIEKCYADVSVNSSTTTWSSTGGLIGVTQNSATIQNCYARGNVTTNGNAAGGLIGYATVGITINNCYATGQVNGVNNIGGLIGDTYSTVSDCFWDINTSGQSSSSGGMGKTTAEMKSVATYTDTNTTGLNNAWDFLNNPNNDTNNNDYWNIDSTKNDGYPYLTWQKFGFPPGIYITEVCDNKTGKPENTGFIEIWNNTGLAADLYGYSIRKGTNPTGYAFIPGSYSYSFPMGISIAENGLMIITNGCSVKSTFESTWNVSLEGYQFFVGNDSLEIANGFAYALETVSRDLLSETPEVEVNERIYQEDEGSWIQDTSSNGTPGDAEDDDPPTPIELSAFFAVQTNNDQAQINWITQSESNMIGFNIFRNTEEDEATSNKINPNLIEASNTSQEHEYSFLDEEIELDRTNYYWLENVELDGSSNTVGPISIIISSVENETVPDFHQVGGINSIFPNPFSLSTGISYYLTEDSEVTLEIFNSKGQKIHRIEEGIKESGTVHFTRWNSTTSNSGDPASGIYFFKMSAGNSNTIKKAVLVK